MAAGVIAFVITLDNAAGDESVIGDGHLTTGIVRKVESGRVVTVALDDEAAAPRRRSFEPFDDRQYPIGERVLLWADDDGGAVAVALAPYDLGPTLLTCSAFAAAGLALAGRTMLDWLDAGRPRRRPTWPSTPPDVPRWRDG